MANSIMNKGPRCIYYAPTMRNVVNQLCLVSRSLVSSPPQESSREGVISPIHTTVLSHDPNFPLPGNVGVDLKNFNVSVKSRTSSPKPKYESLASSLLKLENENFRKNDLINQYAQYQCEEEEIVYDSNRKVECTVQECPRVLKKDFQRLFTNSPDKHSNLTVITISQSTKNDMSVWSEDVEKEREDLIEAFVENAKILCTKIKNGGYWADFIEPFSGHAFYSDYRHETLFETDDRFDQLGFHVEDLGCCKVLQHKKWKNNIFVGVIFTDAPTHCHVFNDM